ncbi:Ymc1p [Sugiyamaella lignohabitans]|uniref:Ymc1p n=1 Tax=Sugiyamaella lignohabitans TaxID=796027 RepID=A0A167CFJ0_9ASCO|nr:Ymc1p [Sugiyamaella lignohabitans]ANB11623.1 Ymc1p [Sugiyamaella lignohabitans]
MKRTLTASNERKGWKDPGLTHNQFYVAGAAAGLANGFLACPIEHIRIRLQTQGAGPALYKGPIDCIRKITAASGTSGLFRGIVPTLVREGHGMGAYFLTFEALVDRDIRKNNIARKDIPGWRLCSYGAMAGYAMWITAYPIDVIKSKLQTDKLNKSERQFKSSLDCARQILKTNGVKGFFRGFLPTMLRAAPVNACTFYTFELTIRYLG